MVHRAKTCVYAIALNEIKHVDKFMEACKGADLVLVCDTGSTDGTQERLRKLGAVVYDIVQKPWRFDVPRNTALSLIPEDIDICLSIDIDEFLQPGWTDALEREWQRSNGKVHRIGYDYIWNWKPNGDPDIRFIADKTHARKGYRWKHPCHETLYYEGDDAETRIVITDIVLHHRADNTKSRGQYLPLLQMAVEEDPDNDRMRHYYARELMYNNKWLEAIKEFDVHLTMPSSKWAEERASSLRYKSRCYRSLGNMEESLKTAILGTIEWPHSREPWLELANVAYAMKNWRTCFYASTQCLAITTRSSTYIGEGISWSFMPYDLAALSAYNIGFYEKAVEYGEKALELEPKDQRLKTNLDFYKEKYPQALNK